MAEPLRVLLTNDDGIDAPGIAALREVLEQSGGFDVWTVAPDRERSTCSHGMTLGAAVSVTLTGHQAFAVGGLPADCVFIAKNGLLPDPPDVVISGINRGANLGSDVIFSGTVAGARQAALMGMHGIAVSLVDGDDYSIAAEMTVDLIRRNASRLPAQPLLLNLNFPAGRPSGIQLSTLGKRNYPQALSLDHPFDGKRTAFRLGGPDVHDALLPDSDGLLIHRGIASATLLTADQTDRPRMPALRLEGIEMWEDAAWPQSPSVI